MKAHIIPTLLNSEKNKELTGKVPCREIMDFLIVYRFIEDSDEGLRSAIITNEILSELEMTPEELDAVAFDNYIRDYKTELLELTKSLKVMTNIKRIYGSTGMLCKEIMDEAYKVFAGGQDVSEGTAACGSDFYILPVSVHEIMLIGSGEMTLEEMADIQRRANSMLGSEDEFVSENIYRYISEAGRVELVTVR